MKDKRKEREKKVRKKVLDRRLKLRAERKKDKELKEIEERTKQKNVPINREEYEKVREIRKQEVILQLQHNQEILKAIETEMANETVQLQPESGLEKVE